ncbi:MAG: DUF3999 family protein [SAR202 cluster bacterium]|nr:DUF3999 family protein [SAR202 cluster bacterium]
MKLRHKLRLALVPAGLMILVFGAGQALADFSHDDWRFVKEIKLPSSFTDEGLVEVIPDSEVFARANSGLTDLRIVADEGSETPYRFEVSSGRQERTSAPATLRDSGHVPGQYTTFIADRGVSGSLHNEIEFKSSSSDFTSVATVETSEDTETWSTVGEGPVYNLSVSGVGTVSRDTRLGYKQSSARYVRVRIADQGGGPIDVRSATVSLLSSTVAQEVQWPSSIVSVAQDIELNATLVDVDLTVQGQPSHRLNLQIADANFHRSVTIETSNDLERWRGLASGEAIFSYKTPKFVGSDLTVSYPETTARYIRILIFNQDDLPLDIQGVEAWGLQRRLLFTADPELEYKLYYGNPEADRPFYDIDRMFHFMETESVLKASLGEHRSSERFLTPVVAEPVVPLSERLPWLLPVVIGGAAAIIGLFLFGVARRAKTLLPPPTP